MTRRTGARRAGSRRRGRQPRPGESRQFFQFMACSGAFVLLVTAKLLLPERIAPWREKLDLAMEKNMDVQAVFSAVGRALSRQSDPAQAAEEVYQAVFSLTDREAAVEAGVVDGAGSRDSAALEALREYRPDSSPGSSGEESAPEKKEENAEGSAPEPEAENASEDDRTPATGNTESAGTENAEAERAPEHAAEQESRTLSQALYSDQNLPENVNMEQVILNFDYLTPVDGVLTSAFGYRDHPLKGEEKFHYGVDLAAESGTDILCFAAGTVTAVGDSSSYGKYCIVSHTGGFSTLYAHCSRITAASGTAVGIGQKIAEVGQTGLATGPHLHFELQCNGVYLNPVYYVSHR